MKTYKLLPAGRTAIADHFRPWGADMFDEDWATIEALGPRGRFSKAGQIGSCLIELEPQWFVNTKPLNSRGQDHLKAIFKQMCKPVPYGFFQFVESKGPNDTLALSHNLNILIQPDWFEPESPADLSGFIKTVSSADLGFYDVDPSFFWAPKLKSRETIYHLKQDPSWPRERTISIGSPVFADSTLKAEIKPFDRAVTDALLFGDASLVADPVELYGLITAPAKSVMYQPLPKLTYTGLSCEEWSAAHDETLQALKQMEQTHKIVNGTSILNTLVSEIRQPNVTTDTAVRILKDNAHVLIKTLKAFL